MEEARDSETPDSGGEIVSESAGLKMESVLNPNVTHSCDQNRASIYNQIFRNRVMERIANDQRAKFGKAHI